ncbi:MAG: NAD(P)-binding protein [Rhizobiales bacterium]|nr:NAD(P)-binding protein [Hyphomicrobiales bacterium]
MRKSTSSSAEYDLIIVGASFSGLVAARTAAMRGLKVAVIERKPEAGARVHTTGILVKEAAEELDIPHSLTRRIHGVRLYGPSLRSIDLYAPGSYFLTTRTADLLRWLAEEARRAGAHLHFNARFRGGEREASGLSLAEPTLRARYLIGADGARSRVARTFGLGRNTRFLVGVEAEYEGLAKVDQRFLHCFLDSRLAPGYLGWVAPGPTVTQVGLAVHDRARPDLAAFEARTNSLFDYRSGQVVERRSGVIPCGGVVSPIAAPGVLLIGDAAGLVSPATAGGIRLAFHFARRAALAVADHLQHLGPPPEAVLAPLLPRFRLKGAMRWLLDREPPNAAIDLALSTAAMRHFAQWVYFHRRNASGLTFAEFQAHLARAAGPLETLPGTGGREPITGLDR